MGTRSGVSRRRRAAIINVTISPFLPQPKFLLPFPLASGSGAAAGGNRCQCISNCLISAASPRLEAVLVLVCDAPPCGLLIGVRQYIIEWLTFNPHTSCSCSCCRPSSLGISHQDVWPESGRKRWLLHAGIDSYSCGLNFSYNNSKRIYN